MSSAEVTGRAVNEPGVVASVVAAFERYEAALVANDLDALEAFMWRDEHLVRVGIDDRQDGFVAVSAFRRSLVTQTPPRVLRDTVVVTFGDHTAVVTTTFLPTDDSPAGRQSQTWVRMPAAFRALRSSTGRSGTGGYSPLPTITGSR